MHCILGIETRDSYILFKQRKTKALISLCDSTADQHLQFLAHLSRRLVGELIVYPWSGVRLSSSSTISNMNISATSGRIIMKFYQKHHLDGGKAALDFGQI